MEVKSKARRRHVMFVIGSLSLPTTSSQNRSLPPRDIYMRDIEQEIASVYLGEIQDVRIFHANSIFIYSLPTTC